MRRLRVPPQKFDFLTEEEAQRLLGCAEDEPWHTMILVAMKTGLRHGELLGLKWEDVDFSRRMMAVRRSVVRNVIDSPKNNRERHIPLTTEVCRALLRLRQSSGFVFRLRDEGPMNHKAPPQAIHRICEKAGLRKIGWHVLRHTFASHLAMKGVSIQKIQSLMGHTDIKITMRYAHLGQSTLRDAIQVLESEDLDVLAIFGQQAVNTPHATIAINQKRPDYGANL